MPRPKRIQVRTIAPPYSAAAKDEFTTGVQYFIEWANRARNGETALPAALQADATLTAFSEGRFDAEFSGLAPWAVLYGCHILHLVRNGHWHLRTCRICNRWLLVKDKKQGVRGKICRRVECRSSQRAEQRKARHDRDEAAKARARRAV